jgi:hypothetical protein
VVCQPCNGKKGKAAINLLRRQLLDFRDELQLLQVFGMGLRQIGDATNKLARTAWAILAKGQSWRASAWQAT